MSDCGVNKAALGADSKASVQPNMGGGIIHRGIIRPIINLGYSFNTLIAYYFLLRVLF